MPIYLLLALLALIGAYLFGRWFAHTPPEQVSRALRRAGLYLGAALFFYLVITGRLHWLFTGIALLLPFALRLLRAWRTLKQLRGAARPGPQISEIETRFLRMTLDHESGVLSGLVLEGRHRGRTLQQLTPEELLELLGECRIADPESTSVLEAYLDRTYGTAWRTHQREAPASPQGGAMSKAEAYEILGLEPGADAEQVRTAHRRLMQKLHPDRGGSTYLAAKINEAKQRLLGE